MLPRVSLDEALREAREAVLEWRDVRGMPRPDGLGRGEPVRLVRAEIRVAHEARSLDAKSEPAPADAEPGGAAPLDPWSVEVDAPRDGREWSRRIPMPAHARIDTCPVCKGAKRFRCDDCDGRGYKTETTYDPITGVRTTRTFACGTCAATKTVPCGSCRGTARVKLLPAVVIETGASVRRAIVHDGSVPAELVAEMKTAGNAKLWNEKELHAGEGEDPESAPWGGSRPTALAPAAAAAIDALWSEPAGEGRRLRAWRVEVVEGQVVQFVLSDRKLWVWGSPPRVAGDDEPVAAGSRRLGIAIGAGIVFGIAALLWWWLG
jgi:hypothetical protein